MTKVLLPIGLALAALAVASVARPADARCNLKAADAAHAGKNCQRAWMDANLKLNDLMSIGTHNSYKTTAPEAVLAMLSKASHDSLDYGHRPLTEELDAGARQLEIDVYYDPKGGRFADPVRLRQAGVQFLGEPIENKGNRLVFFADGDGNFVHLVHRQQPLV